MLSDGYLGNAKIYMNLIVNQTKLHEHLSKLGNEAILKCNAIVTEVGLDLEEKVRQEEKCGL